MASHAQMVSPKSRLGRRPMRVDTMLKKEKEGTLYKYTKMAEQKSLAKMREEEEKEERTENTKPKPGFMYRLSKFLIEHPEAEDYEVHALAQKEGINVHHLEEQIYELTSKLLRGKEKTAEPPPPKGVPSKLWGKRLEYGPGEKVPAPLSRKIDRLIKNAYKLQGHTEVQGIPIAIENRKGSVRKGTDKDGHEWRTKMKHPYGYIVGTKGADGDPVDVYVGPDKDAPKAYVVHQHKPDGTGYDEDKVMLGFSNKREAQKAYLKHYDSDKFLGPISIVTMERLRELVEAKRKMVKISTVNTAFLDELGKLAEKQVYEQAALTAPPIKLPPIGKKIRTKITGPISKTEAEESLRRLRSLEKKTAPIGELARGAAIGALVVPAATLLGRKVSGQKIVGKAFKGYRELAAISGTGALYGGVIPALRHRTEKEVEKQKLREYLGHSKGGTFRSKIKRTMGL